MRGYEKGTTAAGEVTVIREAFSRAASAILSVYGVEDAIQALQDASKLGSLGKVIESQAGDLRGKVAAYLHDVHAMPYSELAKLLGVNRSRAQQIVTKGQTEENPVSDPGTTPEPPSLALAIITSPLGLLVEHRVDRIPPYTFPAAEIRDGESPAAALIRRVPEETGLNVTPDHVIGKRIHPKTGRVMIYMEAAADGTEVQVGDPEELDEVRWISLADADQLMPDMFPTVRQHLGRVLAALPPRHLM